jgi:hypothetical protein
MRTNTARTSKVLAIGTSPAATLDRLFSRSDAPKIPDADNLTAKPTCLLPPGSIAVVLSLRREGCCRGSNRWGQAPWPQNTPV